MQRLVQGKTEGWEVQKYSWCTSGNFSFCRDGYIVGNGKEYLPGQVLVGGGKVEGQNSLPGLGEPLMASNRGVPDKTVQGTF